MPRDTEHNVDDLPIGTQLLRNQYRIERRLDDGGFGIAYLARDSLDRRVVVKECYPYGISCRDGVEVVASSADYTDLFAAILTQFKQEAQRLAALTHPNIVGVHQIFEENGTAYMAMEYVKGTDLTTIAEQDPDRITPALVERALDQALSAIRYIHDQGVLHRDIAPDNMLLGADDHLTLIDFGAAFENRGNQTAVENSLLAVKDGYSPFEFYSHSQAQNASSDLYALGATFYNLITGAPPPDSHDRFTAINDGKTDPYQRLAGGDWSFKPSLLVTIDSALEVLQKDRIQSVDDWIAQLREEIVPPQETLKPAATVATDISEAAILQLVSDTNMEITPGTPDALSKEQTVRKQEDATTETKPWVDMFGNPIQDVDAFLKEQDRQSRKGKSNGTSAQGSHLMVEGARANDDAQGKSRFSLIGKLLGRRSSSKKRPSNSAMAQT